MNIDKLYPRPQLYRKNWQILNGSWNFKFDENNIGEKENWQKKFPSPSTINVPFSYETKLSNIGEEKFVKVVWYERNVELSEVQLSGNLFLNFEGSDFYTKVYINGVFVKEHKGGNTRFSVDISNFAIVGKNSITVRVEDDNSPHQLVGKQRWVERNFGCWYLQTTGIWKTVWLEWTKSKKYIDAVKITPNIRKKEVKLDIKTINTNSDDQIMINISFNNVKVTSLSLNCFKKDISVSLNIESKIVSEWGIAYWSVDNPDLYDIELILKKDAVILDSVNSYFGMRNIEIHGPEIIFNGRKLYQRLLLDQGYWKDSNLTCPSYEALEEDILKAKQLGYNGVRKHQKIEDERFYSICDKVGMLVWAEAPSAFEFNDSMISNFVSEWTSIVEQLYNHPSIITWTPINESWGVSDILVDYKQQKFSEAIYNLTKSLDDTRPVIVNDGWEHTVSDIITLHDYESNLDKFNERYIDLFSLIKNNQLSHNKHKLPFAEGYKYNNQPIIISEFGGIAFDDKEEGHWGYGDQVKTENEFLKRFSDFVLAIKDLPYVSGYCYTQLSDVQQEVNGLLTELREFKINPNKIREINLK